MPAKRVIIRDRCGNGLQYMRAVLWADVPAGNRLAYTNPSATSVYENITPAELQAIRDGLVVEREVMFRPDAGSLTLGGAQTYFLAQQVAFQSEMSAITPWSDFGCYYDGAAWQATTGVPMFSVKAIEEGLPTFWAVTPVSAFGNNKFQFVLFNGAAAATSQGLIVRVRLVLYLPGQTAVTGAISTPWQLRRREGPTTNPSGTGGIIIGLNDTAQILPTGIGAWNAPQVAPAGGTTTLFSEFTPQPDELKLTTADAPSLTGINEWAGLTIYRASTIAPAQPIAIRAGQTLEVQQSGTGGTGNGRIVCLFTVG